MDMYGIQPFDMQKIMQLPFDADTHKKIFSDCLEVIIDEKGIVHYAYPSHQECLIRYACSALKITREQLQGLCPVECCNDIVSWLCRATGCVSVWNTHFKGMPNRQQLAALNKLRKEDLYKG